MAMRSFLQRKLLRRSTSFSALYHSPYPFTTPHHSDHLFSSAPSSSLPSFARTQHFLLPSALHSFSHSFSTHESAAVDDFAATQLVGHIVDESILPVRALASLLDSYHDLSGFPWWVVIASGTLAMRLTLFPILVFQLHKLKRIGELLPKLPLPFPPPMSGRTFKAQFELFRKERRAAGCPSYLWFIGSYALQIPCFLLWITTIRRMSLDHHPGFDCGGTLWFQDLTEVPNGALGPIFPLLIAVIHFANVQASFQKSDISTGGVYGSLAKNYKTYLGILTVPILFCSFILPQGSLVYWLTNSLINILQQISLKHPDIRKKLGLPERDVSASVAKQKELINSGAEEINTSRKSLRIHAKHLSPKELVNMSITFLAKGQKDMALKLLRLALDKDPDNARALILVGQTQFQNGCFSEATVYLERCISKLLQNGHPTEVEAVDNLILSSQWAGVAFIRQEKYEEGIAHLERVAMMKEPEHSKTKSHYYDAVVLLSSALFQVGRKAEAANYLRMAVAYDSSYKELLEQCENDEETKAEFSKCENGAVSSGRAD